MREGPEILRSKLCFEPHKARNRVRGNEPRSLQGWIFMQIEKVDRMINVSDIEESLMPSCNQHDMTKEKSG